MQKLISTILVIYLGILYAQNAFSAECQDYTDKNTCETNGCVYTSSICTPCDINQYRSRKTDNSGYECKDCRNGPTDPAGKACGADDAMCQYTGNNGDSPSCRWTMTCDNKPGFQHGTWAPDATPITYDGTGNPPSCAYTNANNITCDATGAPLCPERGFHPLGSECHPSVATCTTNAISGLSFHDVAAQCFIAQSNCPENTTFTSAGITCNGASYGICKSTTISCKSYDAQINHLDPSKCSGGEISGDAQYDYDNDEYDFSTCKCEFNIANFENGTATTTCYFTSNGGNITACSTKINSCDTGFCSANNTTCDSIPAGYYSVGTAVKCNKCPYGATSDGGTNASGASSCYWNADTTFIDSVGAFRLPVPTDGKIIMQIN